MTAPTPALFPGKHFISTVLAALETKQAMSGGLVRRYLQRSAMAGFVIGLMYVTSYAITAGFDGIGAGDGTTWRPLGRLVGCFVFGFALVVIHYSKSELLTSNMMVVSVGAYHRRTSWWRALRLLGLCYLGNLLGGLAIAVLLRFSTLAAGPVWDELTAAVDHKLEYVAAGPSGWADLLVRAVLCNFLINIAMLLVYNGLITDDLTRSLVMATSVFVFAYLGLEHSVANTVLLLVVALREHVDAGLAIGNLALALLGNFVGGGLLVGLYYAYVNDDRGYRSRTPAPGA